MHRIIGVLLLCLLSAAFAFQAPLPSIAGSHLSSLSRFGAFGTTNVRYPRGFQLQEGGSPDNEPETEQNEEVAEAEAEAMGEKSDDVISKEILLKAYSNSKTLYGTAALLMLLGIKGPGLRATKIGAAAGFALAGGLSAVLEEASTHDRLKSDTYKCLNIGMLSFCLFGVFAIPAEAGLVPIGKITTATVIVFLTIVKFFGAYAALNGWKAGAGEGETNLRQEWRSGFFSSLQVIRGNVKKTAKGRAYTNLVLTVGTCAALRAVELFLSILKKSPITVDMLYLSAIGRLSMITTMCYCLKSAYERDRLTGTTFMQLTEMLFYWFLSVGIAQGIQPDRTFLWKKAKMLLMAPPLVLEMIRVRRMKNAESSN